MPLSNTFDHFTRIDDEFSDVRSRERQVAFMRISPFLSCRGGSHSAFDLRFMFAWNAYARLVQPVSAVI